MFALQKNLATFVRAEESDKSMKSTTERRSKVGLDPAHALSNLRSKVSWEWTGLPGKVG
jgi:hypothetical protein